MLLLECDDIVISNLNKTKNNIEVFDWIFS